MPTPPRRWFQVSLRTILVLVAVIAVGLSAYVAYERWHASKYPRLHSWRILHRSIKGGDSIDRVRWLLPSSVVADEKETSLYRKMISRRPLALAPDGYKPDDFLLVYKVENSIVFLQFRDEVLINHDPEEFANPVNSRPVAIF